jgi:hypothetical protein
VLLFHRVELLRDRHVQLRPIGRGALEEVRQAACVDTKAARGDKEVVASYRQYSAASLPEWPSKRPM